MRIAMVSEHASPLATLGGADAGGQNVHVAALAKALAGQGAEVVVHTRRDDPALDPQVIMAPGVTVEHIDAGPPRPIPKDELVPWLPDLAAGLARSWGRDRPDIVHAHFWMSGAASLAAARPRGIPILQTFHALGSVKRRHQGAADTSPPQRAAAETKLIRRCDRIIATCTDEVDELAALGADVGHVWVVPCGVDLDQFRPGHSRIGDQSLPAPAARRPFRLVIVSRLVERKGIGDAVRALASVPDAELLVAGGPSRRALARDPEARRLQSLAADIGVADRFHLLGGLPREEIPPLLCSADAVLCVPWYEPFGIVAVEAMACGVPVIASAVGGHRDTVVDGGTGLLVPPRRPDRLAEALGKLLASPAMRRRMGAGGAARAHAQYGWDRVAEATLDVYQGCLAAAAAGPSASTPAAGGGGR